MPIKKLVELNGEYGGWLEIDPVRLKRVATQFLNWLLITDHGQDEFGFMAKDLPIVEGVIHGGIKLPFHASPHARDWGEGILPVDYQKIAAPFYNTIAGGLYAPPEVIMKDGRYYAWAEWEDPPENS